MKLYKHTGNGHFIGSICIVISETREAAEAVIRARLNSSGLKKEKLNISEESLKPGVVYFADGDY